MEIMNGELPKNNIRTDLSKRAFIDKLTQFKDISEILLICSHYDIDIAHEIQKEFSNLRIRLLFIPEGLMGIPYYWCVCSLVENKALFDGDA